MSFAGALSEAAVETLADVSSACTPGVGSTATLRWLAAIHNAGEGMVRLEHLIRTAGWANHLTGRETAHLVGAAKEVGAMLLVLAVIIRDANRGRAPAPGVWHHRAAG